MIRDCGTGTDREKLESQMHEQSGEQMTAETEKTVKTIDA